MISVIAVAVAVAFAIAVTLASPERFADNLRKSRILVAVLCVDMVFMAVNLILAAMSLQLIPSVKCIAAMVLTVVTVFAALAGTTDRVSVYAIACVLTLIFVQVGVIFIPVDHGVKEFNGEEYVGIDASHLEPFGTLEGLSERDQRVYYYKKVFPLVISKNHGIVEYYDGSITEATE